jgi:hypothetical protein
MHDIESERRHVAGEAVKNLGEWAAAFGRRLVESAPQLGRRGGKTNRLSLQCGVVVQGPPFNLAEGGFELVERRVGKRFRKVNHCASRVGEAPLREGAPAPSMRVHLADVVGDLLMRDVPAAIVALGHIRIAGSTI